MSKVSSVNKKDERAFHPPLSMIVEGIGDVPTERIRPAQTQMTVIHLFTRQKAAEMISFLQAHLEKEHLEIIAVEVTGPRP